MIDTRHAPIHLPTSENPTTYSSRSDLPNRLDFRGPGIILATVPEIPAVAVMIYVAGSRVQLRARSRHVNFTGYITLPELSEVLWKTLLTCVSFDLAA